MPHLVILYSGNLDAVTDIGALGRALADTLIAQRDDGGQAVFPVAGTRVLAYPAAHFAVADGSGDFGFVYLNLRMARGRSGAVHARIGEALSATVKAHFTPLMAERPIGITLQIDEGAEVVDAKLGNLHAHFAQNREA